MIKKSVFFVLSIFLASLVFSAKVGTLPEVMKPDNITVRGDELYVVEGSTIYIYSLEDLKLTRKFGKNGEGPGELLVIPGIPNKIIISDDYILAETPHKIIYFSQKGELVKEKKRTSPLTFGFIPIGKNFVGIKQQATGKGKVFSSICIFDPELKEIKELHRQKWVQQAGVGGKISLDMVMDFIHYKVYDNKIFIEESPKGFLIEVFDYKGDKLYQVEKDYEAVKVTDKVKEEIIDRFKEDPAIKMQIAEEGGWNALKKLISMNFPDTFPAVQDIGISNDKIYVQTFKKVNGKEEYVIMDLKGKIIKKGYAPAFEGTPLLARILGAKLHTIANGKLYYLQDNIDEEEWELYCEAIE